MDASSAILVAIAVVVVGVGVGVVALGLIVRRSKSRGGHRPAPSPDFEALERSDLFELFHVIPRRFSNHPAIDCLNDRGGFDFEHARNTLMLPVDQALADKLGLSVYTDTPLPAYVEGVQGQLDRIWGSQDAVAARNGDEAAVGRIADRIYGLADVMKAGLVNGDLIADVKRL